MLVQECRGSEVIIPSTIVGNLSHEHFINGQYITHLSRSRTNFQLCLWSSEVPPRTSVGVGYSHELKACTTNREKIFGDAATMNTLRDQVREVETEHADGLHTSTKALIGKQDLQDQQHQLLVGNAEQKRCRSNRQHGNNERSWSVALSD